MEYLGRMEITTRIGCSCNCVYCPQSLLIKEYMGRNQEYKPDVVMLLDTFKTCVDKLPMGTRIDFSGMAEPWLNDACTDMVLYAHSKGFPIAIYSTLVGMTIEDFNRIKNIPFDEFVVHIPDDKGNANIEVTTEYINLLEYIIDAKNEKGLKVVTGFSCHAGIHPKIVEAIPKDSKLITEIHNRAGNVEDDSVEMKCNRSEIVCVNCGTQMNHNVLLPDGTVLLCCMDYGMKHILGNLITQTYEDIMDSDEAKMVRKGLLCEDSNILCRNCVNGRNIYEIFEDYKLFRDWNKKMQCNIEDIVDAKKNVEVELDKTARELDTYVAWVKNLQEQIEQLNEHAIQEAKAFEERYEARMVELREYVEWVANLQRSQQDNLRTISDLQEKQQACINENKKIVVNCEERERKLLEERDIYIEKCEKANKKLSEVERELEEIKGSRIYDIYRRIKK